MKGMAVLPSFAMDYAQFYIPYVHGNGPLPTQKKQSGGLTACKTETEIVQPRKERDGGRKGRRK